MIKINDILYKIKTDRFFQDSFWALIGNTLAKGMTLVGAIFVARFLGKEIYGEYGVIRSTLMNIAILSTFGLGYTATKYISEYKKDKPKYLNTIASFTMKISFVVSSIMAVLLFFFADYVAVKILSAPHLKTPLRFVAVWIVFNSLTTAQIGLLAGFNAFKPMARISMFVGFFAFLSSVGLTYYYNLNGALFALLLTQILNWYLNYIEVRKHIPQKSVIQERKYLLNKLLKFSLPVALQEALYSLSSWFMILLLIKLSNYGEVGLYSAAMQWSTIVLFIPGILRNVILSHLSDHFENTKEQIKIINRTLLINFIVTFIPFIFFYFLKNRIVGLYGDTYKSGLEQILIISLLSVIFASLSNVYAQAYLSIGENWIMFLFRFLRDTSMLVLTWYFMVFNIFEGALALVTSSLINQVLFLVIISLFYKYKLNISVS